MRRTFVLRQIHWILVVLLVATAAPMPASAGGPAGLPTHFGIGLVASNDAGGMTGWMPDSKVPWDYAYQYLSGGANSGHGWATWNDKGQFALYYAKAAATHGYVPVFSYYQLLFSDGPCGGCGEGEKDMAHLNDPATMRAYFDDYTTLMKRLSAGSYDGIQGFGQTAIVHVEPDLSGFAEHAAQLDDPTSVPAAVASSGNPDVAGLPDTYQGFNWALLHLRDEYAPNVLLGFHVSAWATGTDIGSSHDATINAADIGAKTGYFAAESGVLHSGPGTSTYDLLFNDVLDRDAGFYLYAQKDPNRWWDKLNIAYPNFQRWEQWLGSVARSAGHKPIFIWQIPLGNQYFQTENNSAGHYQDNRAEYFFSHLDELRQMGIIALLFGGGGGQVTSYNDAAKDGITNPPSFCTSDGVSTGQVCNDHVSTVADDDGGFLRMAAQQYYANPVPVVDLSSSSDTPASTQAGVSGIPAPTVPLQIDLGGSSIIPPVTTAGQDVTLRQNTISNTDGSVLIDFELFDALGQQVFQAQLPNQPVLVGTVSSSSTVFSLPDDLPRGRYMLKVGVYSNDGSIKYAWTDSAAILTVR